MKFLHYLFPAAVLSIDQLKRDTIDITSLSKAWESALGSIASLTTNPEYESALSVLQSDSISTGAIESEIVSLYNFRSSLIHTSGDNGENDTDTDYETDSDYDTGSDYDTDSDAETTTSVKASSTSASASSTTAVVSSTAAVASSTSSVASSTSVRASSTSTEISSTSSVASSTSGASSSSSAASSSSSKAGAADLSNNFKKAGFSAFVIEGILLLL